MIFSLYTVKREETVEEMQLKDRTKATDSKIPLGFLR